MREGNFVVLDAGQRREMWSEGNRESEKETGGDGKGAEIRSRQGGKRSSYRKASEDRGGRRRHSHGQQASLSHRARQGT